MRSYRNAVLGIAYLIVLCMALVGFTACTPAGTTVEYNAFYNVVDDSVRGITCYESNKGISCVKTRPDGTTVTPRAR